MRQQQRLGLLCATTAAAAAVVIAGCGAQVTGTPTTDAADVAAYKTTAAAASSAAAASKAAAARTQAIKDNCGQFATTTSAGVKAYNDFITAHDTNAPDYAAKRDGAATTLDNAALKVETGVVSAVGALPTELAEKFTAYVTAARDLAAETKKMTYSSPVAKLNEASRRINGARTAVHDACQAN
ncbi:hypothetical protein [Nocardia camponoti]|uniref:Lipoprotein n=1 Tax=Nocardia camponoti TaxID=1616106 RepID=A0A917QPI0_9NOCA|nr:hypothetical protein [Nocardia camponoti]GGK61701.1 hypothetical protein GCM10011591_37480 [Nocardia camponoti]